MNKDCEIRALKNLNILGIFYYIYGGIKILGIVAVALFIMLTSQFRSETCIIKNGYSSIQSTYINVNTTRVSSSANIEKTASQGISVLILIFLIT